MSRYHVVCRDCAGLEGLTETEEFAIDATEAHEFKNPDHTVALGVIAE